MLTPDEAAASLTDAQRAMLHDLVQTAEAEARRTISRRNHAAILHTDDIYLRHLGPLAAGAGAAPAAQKVLDVLTDTMRANGWRVTKLDDDRESYKIAPEQFYADLEAGRVYERPRRSWAWLRGLAVLLFPISIPLWVVRGIIGAWRMSQTTQLERENRAAALVFSLLAVGAVLACGLILWPLMR